MTADWAEALFTLTRIQQGSPPSVLCQSNALSFNGSLAQEADRCGTRRDSLSLTKGVYPLSDQANLLLCMETGLSARV